MVSNRRLRDPLALQHYLLEEISVDEVGASCFSDMVVVGWLDGWRGECEERYEEMWGRATVSVGDGGLD